MVITGSPSSRYEIVLLAPKGVGNSVEAIIEKFNDRRLVWRASKQKEGGEIKAGLLFE